MKDVIGDSNSAGYDEANALVLPSQKRATKIKVEKRQNVKILTKKQRKHLQQIVDKKKKKEGVSASRFHERGHLNDQFSHCSAHNCWRIWPLYKFQKPS